MTMISVTAPSHLYNLRNEMGSFLRVKSFLSVKVSRSNSNTLQYKHRSSPTTKTKWVSTGCTNAMDGSLTFYIKLLTISSVFLSFYYHKVMKSCPALYNYLSSVGTNLTSVKKLFIIVYLFTTEFNLLI